MANTLSFFMAPEDEVAFLRAIEPHQFVIYPEVFASNYQPFSACAKNANLLADEAYYLALPNAGPMVTRQVKRGPHAGMLEVDEVRSPVIFFERSVMVDEELRSGRLWAELESLGDRQHLMSKPDVIRAIFDRLRGHFKKHFQASQPRGFFIGGMAARRAMQGLTLREAGRKGGLVAPYRK